MTFATRSGTLCAFSAAVLAVCGRDAVVHNRCPRQRGTSLTLSPFTPPSLLSLSLSLARSLSLSLARSLAQHSRDNSKAVHAAALLLTFASTLSLIQNTHSYMPLLFF
eukprot:2108889-Rhodomonas_salina.2